MQELAQMRQVIEKRDAWKAMGFAVLPVLQVNETQCFFTEEYIEKSRLKTASLFEFITEGINVISEKKLHFPLIINF